MLSSINQDGNHSAVTGGEGTEELKVQSSRVVYIRKVSDQQKWIIKTGLDNEQQDSEVVHMFKPLGRPENLDGKTYKLRWPDSDHAIYITINDICDEYRRLRPFEIFINSKNMEHFSWTVGLTRMISAVFRRGGDVSFVVEELKAVFDPRGGQWMKGRYVPSLLAAIGEVIECHMVAIGFLPKETEKAKAPKFENDIDGIDHSEVNFENKKEPIQSGHSHSSFRQCPKCAEASIVRQEGCDVCVRCSYAKCG